MKFPHILVLGIGFVVASLAAGLAMAATPPPDTATVWTGGESGKAVYTIPGLLVTKSGVVIAYAEARERRGDGGKVDIVLKRSLDGGRTWLSSFFIERAQGIENYVLATLVQDRVSGRVFFFTALRDKGLADTTTTNSYRTSDDDGATWSAAHDITGLLYAADQKLQVDLRDGRAPAGFTGDNPDLFGRQLVFFGPGRSIQLSTGHPSFPNRIPRDDEKIGSALRANGTILMSYDEGRTWPVKKLLVPGSFGYSNMDLLPDGTVVIVYENATGTTVSATRFTLEWLTDGRDTLTQGRK